MAEKTWLVPVVFKAWQLRQLDEAAVLLVPCS